MSFDIKFKTGNSVGMASLPLRWNGKAWRANPTSFWVESDKFNIKRYLCGFLFTVQTLCIGTDRSQQTVQTKIRLLLKKQSDQGLLCLPFHQHLLDALMQCYIKLFLFLGQLYQLFEVSQIIEFLRYHALLVLL